MQKITITITCIFSCLFFLTAPAFCNQVYVYKLDGVNLYVQSNDTKKQLRLMELVKENSIIEIGKDTTAYITCPECEAIKLTAKQSPYTIKMSNFKKNKSTSKIILKNFAAALKDFIYPDSKAGKLVYMNVRGNEDAPASNDVCQTMAPQDYEDILLLGQDMEFKWGIKGEAFSFKIRNTANDQIVFNAKPQKQSITVPLSKLAPGFVYQWTVKDLKNNTGCQASFSVLSKEESNQIKTDLEQVAKLLPPDADKETKLRLQSGYLLSEGFVFDAFRLFESKGF